jgi:hypothetical protein
LAAAQKIIFLGESGGSDALVQLPSLKDSRREREVLQEKLEANQTELASAHEALELARAAARTEIRPRRKEEAAEALEAVLELNEQFQEAQEQLQARRPRPGASASRSLLPAARIGT